MEFDELAELQQSVNELTELFLGSNSDKGPHTCTTTQDRNKKEVANFYELVQGWLPYSDPDFTPDASSLDWADQGEKELAHFSSVDWVRAQTAFPAKTLFGDGISADDINQGGLGNCWFLAALSAIAEKPGRLEKVFLNTENYQNRAGVYGFEFYSLGVPHTVVIDDFLPLRTGADGKK